MPNALIALQSKPGDIVGSYIGGLQARQNYDTGEAAREKSVRDQEQQALSVLINGAGTILNAPPEQQGPMLERYKAFSARLGIPQDKVAAITVADLPVLLNGFTSLADQQKMQIAGAKGAADVALTEAKIGTEGLRGQDIYAGIGRKDALASNQMGNNNARTGGYLANIGSSIADRDRRFGLTSATAEAGAYGQLPDGQIMSGGAAVNIPGYVPKPTKGAGAGITAKDFPASVIKAEDEDVAALQSAQGLVADTDAWQQRLASGGVDIGGAQNLFASVVNPLGLGDAGTADFAELESFATRLANESLRLNKGVQTEGDAVRASSELLSNLNSPKVVKRQMGIINDLNKRAVQLKSEGIAGRRKRYNLPDADLSAYSAPSSPYEAPGGSSGPQPGAVEDGYRFKGGNPADPNAWEAVQ